VADRPRINPVDLVWESVSDGAWHTLNELTTRLGLGTAAITSALNFLERYDFTESTELSDESYRVTCIGPSPGTATKILRFVRSRQGEKRQY